jgi:hypothetical protein
LRPIFAISRLIGIFGGQHAALLQQDKSLPVVFSLDNCSLFTKIFPQ